MHASVGPAELHGPRTTAPPLARTTSASTRRGIVCSAYPAAHAHSHPDAHSELAGGLLGSSHAASQLVSAQSVHADRL